MSSNAHHDEPIATYLHTNVAVLAMTCTVDESLRHLRTRNLSDRIHYIYVLDNRQGLAGVLPLRKLLGAEGAQQISDLMIHPVTTLPDTATVTQAYKQFKTHKFLALPVIDKESRFIGVLDVTALTGHDIHFERRSDIDEAFETLGFKYSSVNTASAFGAFKYRFPWLIPTTISGIICALLAGLFERTLSESIIIAFFLTLVLGLGESVSIQSFTIAIRQLHSRTVTWRWYFAALRKEALTAILLGIAAAIVVAAVIVIWKHDVRAAIAIGSSVMLSLLTASTFGLSAPALVHALKLDPKVAAGPIALALSDLCTIFFYLGIASLLLK